MRAFKRMTTVFTRLKPQTALMPAARSRVAGALNPWGALRAERESTRALLTLATEIVEEVADEITRLRNAGCDLAALFNDGMLASHIADKFTCSEAEELAEFFRATGHPHVADLWLECHADGDDDEDDLHYRGQRSELALTA
ncbi:hypothetical protein LKL35_26285 [Streptomyces sp. ET3-23]|uniref:hypothetical protein n=1 Tax=Streptomyces sp. ET3-23 TaxID=2885643 RepID=UPI001D12B8DA|nr:hypothetical protein [Streptomyces sp. ET3-23]MCC2278909.1 hypothetical protein [Streptomyces sp. ET3-23]